MIEPAQQALLSTAQLLTRATRYRSLGIAMLILALLNLVGGILAYAYEPLITSACLVMSLVASWLAKTSIRMSADAYRSVISS